jgi:phospholipase/carboxylesterase
LATLLEAVEVETGPQPRTSIIWLHGLGADGHDFEPIVPELAAELSLPVRFVFPHAPVRPVTINNGYRMRAWYDITGFDRSALQDEVGIRGSDAAVRALIQREYERGVETQRIVLAGFSQGGAMALFTGLRYPETLAGIIGLSCYIVLAATFDAERQAANQATAIFMGHGSFDPVVDIRLGEEGRKTIEARGYALDWHAYPMPHSVCPEEIRDLTSWLKKVL